MPHVDTHLIQILLPLYTNEGVAQPKELFAETRRELVDAFGGLTAYTRSPARGMWQEEGGATTRDEIVIYEVMTEYLDEEWWRDYRLQLERRFRQKALIVRAQPVVML